MGYQAPPPPPAPGEERDEGERRVLGMTIKMGPNRQPRLKVPLSKLEIFFELLAAGGCLVLLTVFYQTWGELPEIIPTHFDFFGNPDAWGSRNTLAFIMGLGLLIYVLITVMARFPHIFNYLVPINVHNAADQYRLIRQMLAFLKMIIVAMFAYLNYAMYLVGTFQAAGINNIYMMAFVIALLGGIVVYIYFSLRWR